MKTWIIILTIIYFVLRLICTGISNYIKNDSLEKTKYVILQGSTPLGYWYSILSIVKSLVLCTDVILALILLLDKV